MTSEKKSLENASELVDVPKKRITINIDQISAQIIENLIPAFGKSKSSVIVKMVKDWFDQNSDHVMKEYGIDIRGIRRQTIAQIKGIKTSEELSQSGMELISRLPQVFETVNRTSIEDLADILDVNQANIKKLIIFHRKELLNIGLDLEYNEGVISKNH